MHSVPEYPYTEYIGIRNTEGNRKMNRTYRGYQIRKTDTGSRRLGRVVWYIVDGIGNSHHTTLTNAKKAIDFTIDGNGIDEAHRNAIAAMLEKGNA